MAEAWRVAEGNRRVVGVEPGHWRAVFALGKLWVKPRTRRRRNCYEQRRDEGERGQRHGSPRQASLSLSRVDTRRATVGANDGGGDSLGFWVAVRRRRRPVGG